jgi:hypothetical protein
MLVSITLCSFFVLMDDLVRATADIRLGFHCCDFCCEPQFFFWNGDPAEATVSALAQRKFYVVKKGTPGSEGIYSGWCVIIFYAQLIYNTR